MRVRLKTVLAPASVVGLWLVTGLAVAGDYGCRTCAPPPAPPTPPLPPYNGCAGGGCAPVTPPCCAGGGGGSVNVNVNINNVSANANASAVADARSRAYGRAGAGAGSAVIVAGGGGAYFNVDQPYPLTSGMAVEGMVEERVRVPFSSTRSWEKRYRIQASCIDDRNVPHPASQVRPSREVLESYEGEIYRCIVGTKLQWTKIDAEGGTGETVVCDKGQALWYAGKVLECRAQKPERDCHERSLLRRYGAGVKELVLRGEETITEYREEVVQRSLATSGTLMMDGGVGGRVF